MLSLAGRSALHLAIVNGDLTTVKYLVSQGQDVNAAAPARAYSRPGVDIRKHHENRNTPYEGWR